MARKKRKRKLRLKQCECCGHWYSEDVIFLRAYGMMICLNCLSEKTVEELEEIARKKRKWELKPVKELMSSVQKD